MHQSYKFVLKIALIETIANFVTTVLKVKRSPTETQV